MCRDVCVCVHTYAQTEVLHVGHNSAARAQELLAGLFGSFDFLARGLSLRFRRFAVRWPGLLRLFRGLDTTRGLALQLGVRGFVHELIVEERSSEFDFSRHP